MNRAEIYQGAAERIVTLESECCCGAIWEYMGNWNSQESTDFSERFKPDNCNRSYWGDQWGNDGYTERRTDHAANECRVLALCFAAAMAEQGDI